MEEILQPEAERKQANWVKMSKRKEILQPEAERKQAGWMKNAKTGGITPTGAKKEANKTSRQMLHR